MNRLKKCREDANLLQKDVAKILGISTSAYGFYETDKRTISGKTLQKLAKLYNVSVDYLIGDDTKEDEKENINIGLSAKEYENLSEESKNKIRTFVEFIKQTEEKK